MEKRIIKFRVWDNVDYMAHFDLEDLMMQKCVFTSDCPVMQFTGLLDKHGKEAYHKDIVASGKKHYTISWQAEEARFWLAPLNHTGTWKFMDELDHMEIIGNEFSNPSLLTP